MDRRTFLATTSLAATAAATATTPGGIRVGVIGHTGRGDYGHGLDTVWLRIEESAIVGVADADSAGLRKACDRLNVESGFESYQKMLSETRPEVISVCPRRPDQRLDMILAATEAGVKGIYVEKPFCRTPREADLIVAACRKHDVKLAVAHRNRWHPVLQTIDRLIADGVIGKLLEIRGRGKGDRRGGGEDLWVLGSHVLNLVSYFGGRPLTCSATMLQNGRPVVKSDVKPGNEALGPLAGNEIHARYRMEREMIAYFDSIANDGTKNAGFGLQITGSEGIIDIKCDRNPLAHLIPGNPFQPADRSRPWTKITTAGVGKDEPREELADQISHHVIPVRDLLSTIGTDRQPACHVDEAATTVEMISAVFESHRRQGEEVTLPLRLRSHPLTLL